MLNYLAPINDLSYGVVGANLLMNLPQDTVLWPINVATNNQTWLKQAQKSAGKRANWNPDAPSLRLWHQFNLHEHVGRGPKFGFSIFETNQFTDLEKSSMGWLDGMITCSGWFQEVIEQEVASLRGKTHVVPLGVDRSIFKDEDLSDQHWTTFINIGKWEYRKGHDVLIDAFNSAFEPRDKVRLIMVCYNPFLQPERNDGVDGNKEWEDMYTNTKMGGNITFVHRVETQQQLAAIMQEADCGVFPSRSEGWNLPLLEMMSCGKRVIATDFSAHTEFCNDANCYQIPINTQEDAYDGIWFNGDVGTWADPTESNSYDYLVEAMREVHSLKQNGEMKDNEYGIQTAINHSWANSVEKLLGAIQ